MGDKPSLKIGDVGQIPIALRFSSRSRLKSSTACTFLACCEPLANPVGGRLEVLRGPLRPSALKTYSVEAALAQERHRFVSKEAIGAAAVRHNPLVARQFICPFLKILDRDCDCSVDVTALEFNRRSHVDKHGVAALEKPM